MNNLLHIKYVYLNIKVKKSISIPLCSLFKQWNRKCIMLLHKISQQ